MEKNVLWGSRDQGNEPSGPPKADFLHLLLCVPF